MDGPRASAPRRLRTPDDRPDGTARRRAGAPPPGPRRAARKARRTPGVALAALAALLGAGPPDAADAADGGMLPVPAVTLYPGDEITRAVLAEKFFYFDPDRPLPVVEDAGRLLGKVARRTLVAGKPVPRHGVGEPDLVVRGRPVEARFRRPGLVLSTTLVPLADGGAGEWVRARNPQTGRVVDGLVSRDGTLVVSPRAGAGGRRTAPAGGESRP